MAYQSTLKMLQRLQQDVVESSELIETNLDLPANQLQNTLSPDNKIGNELTRILGASFGKDFTPLNS